MPLPFDATVKELVQQYPRDWLAVLDEGGSGPVSILTPDLSTVSAFTDIVLRVGDALLHLDFQSGPDPGLPRRVLLYNVLLHERYGLPVHSIVVLLRPRADRSDLTGGIRYQPRPDRGGLDFRFEVVRLWQLPAETLLTSNLGTLPLAPLGQPPAGTTVEEALPGIVHHLVDRITQEAPPEQVATLLTAAYVLTGLRTSHERAIELFQGVRAMRDSTTYQAILDEGRAEGLARGRADEARKILLRQGRKRFGVSGAEVEAALQGITDLERLERMSEAVLDASGWQEVLDTP
jgi:predicted transposase YdaD